nr:retrotransposon protein, putative, Ty1-copia subclass [Tanacetum cinerariifolium]
PMRVESVNGKKYILVIVDDYSRFTWVKFLRSNDETPMFIIKFLKMIQDYYEEVGISHETSVARSPQQNGVVERRNRTLIEAAHTMLIYAQAPLFLWAEAVATACFTQNRSIIRLHHGKTPYELMHGLVQKSSSSTSYVSPSRNDWDLLFQSLFDELLNPPPSVDNQAAEFIAPIAEEALTQACWIEAMQEELHEFEHLEVWELVPRPDKVMVITLKWIYKVKVDELGGILKNKARLVTRGYRKEEGIDFEESFAPVLYGLKQALRAWYDMLSSFLLSQDFSKGSVDPTLFIRRNDNDLLLVQIYVDDIIFAASTLELCDLFANLMFSKFKMSMIGKISFFLGLQISQNPR